MRKQWSMVAIATLLLAPLYACTGGGNGDEDEVIVHIYNTGGDGSGSSSTAGSTTGGNSTTGGTTGGGSTTGGTTVPGTWTDLDTVQMPIAIATQGCASLNDVVYTFGGLNGSSQVINTIYKYEPAFAQVTAINPSGTSLPARAYTEAVALGDKIYIFGGSTSSNVLQDAYVFDPATEVLASIASMPEARDAIAAAAVGTDIYVFGGAAFDINSWQVTSTTGIWKYSTTSNSWTTLSTTLPQPTQWAEALSFNGKIYLIGGASFTVNVFASTQTTVANYDTVLEFDPVTETLAYKTSMPGAAKMLSGAVVGSGLYVAGGDTQTGVHNNAAPWVLLSTETHRYDPATDTWETLAEFTTDIPGVGAFGGRCLAGAAEAYGKLVLIGGHTLPSPGLTVPPYPNQQGMVSGIAEFLP